MTPTELILKCIDQIHDSKKPVRDTFMKVLSYIAAQAKVPYATTETFTQEQYEYLSKSIDINCFYEHFEDWISKAMEEVNLIPKMNEEKLQSTIKGILKKLKQCNDKPLLPLFIPPYGWRLVMSLYEKLENNAIYMVAEPDILQYRVMLVNAKIYRLPVIALNVNPDIHNIQLSSKNWNYINLWTRPSWSQLEEIDSDK